MTRLPVEIWFQENPNASDTDFEENLLDLVSAKTLLLLDRGFYHFQFWQQLIDQLQLRSCIYSVICLWYLGKG